MAPRNPAVTIRRAEAADAEAFRVLMASPRVMAGTLQMPHPTAEMWRQRLANLTPDDYLLVACVKSELVGNAGLHPAGKSPRRRHVGTVGVSVRDNWQGKGIGTALFSAVLDIADNWVGYTRLELNVYTDNAAAIELYRKFGFVVEGTHAQYAWRDGNYVDAHAMARVREAPAARRKPATRIRQP